MAGIPRHLILRGKNGSPCFFADEDYLVYLDCLKEEAERYRCAIHAYALMAERVHLLVSSHTEDRLSLMMRCVSGRYVEYVNYIYQRNGVFWEGRRESTVIDSERYLLGCYQHIEWYPVRACMVASPADYRWSSYEHHANGGEDTVIQDHSAYLGLGATKCERQLAYRELFRQPLDDRVSAEFRTSGSCDLALAGDRSRDQIKQLARPERNARSWATEHAVAVA